MAEVKYDYIAITHGERPVAHVYVAPQELSGLDIGIDERDEPDGSKTISGDVFIGNENDGAYTIEFSVTVDKGGVDGLLQFGEREYDLSKGRCFVVRPGYKISQLPCMTKEEGLARLKK